MGELGQVIELMQSARTRYSTLTAEIRSRHHAGKFLQATDRAIRNERPGAAYWVGPAPGPEQFADPTIHETMARLWIENPSRWRFDVVDSEGEPHTEVGRRYWLEPDQPEDYPIPPDTLAFEDVYDPGLLVAELWLEPAETTTVAGRTGLVVRGLPRPTYRTGGREFLHLEPPGDEYELVVDAERGIVLRLSATLEGEPMWLSEVTDVTFDVPLPDDIFERGS